MTNKEIMLQVLYKALGDGVAKLIRNGLAFTVMTGAIGGLLWGILHMHNLHERELIAFKADMQQLRAEHSEQLNQYRRLEYELRSEIAACISERIKDAARIARLEEIVNKKNR